MVKFSTFFVYIADRLDFILSPERDKLFFMMSAFVFFVFQIALVLYPILLRELPVELDDSLVYILKSEQLNECFFQTCTALNTISNQFNELRMSGDYTLANHRQERMFFHVYHPAFSAVLSGIQFLGLSWLDSFNYFRIIASIFIILSIIFWCYALFGYRISGFTLLLGSIVLFPEQGIHLMAPSNFSVGVGFFLFACTIRFPKHSDLIIFCISILLIAFHQIFSVIAFMAWLFHFLMRLTDTCARSYVLCCINLLMAVSYNYIQSHIVEPSFVIPLPDYLSTNFEFFSYLKASVTNSLTLNESWFERIFGNVSLLILPISIIGLLRSSTHRRPQLVFTVVCVISYSCALFYVNLSAPGLLFQRIFMFVSLFGIGLFFQGLLAIMKTNISLFKDNYNYRNLTVLFVALFFMISGLSSHNAQVNARISRHNVSLDEGQVDFLVSSANNGDSVLYTENSFLSGLNEVSALYYFSHGALIFPSHLDFIQPLGANVSDYNFVVTWNPLIPYFSNPHPVVSVHEGFIDIRFLAPVVSQSLRLKLDTNVSDIVVEGVYGLRSGLEFPYSLLAGELVIDLSDTHTRIDTDIRVYGSFALSGISTGSSQGTNWPWGENISIKPVSNLHRNGGNGDEFNFATSFSRFPSFYSVHDGGYTVLLRQH